MSILKRLEDRLIIEIHKSEHGDIYIVDACEHRHWIEIKPQELIELGEEIKALGEKYLKEAK